MSTVEGILSAFPPNTEYGITFRALCDNDQKLEVIRLNKGAASGMKDAIRKTRIDVQYKDLVSEKMKAFIVSSRTEQGRMFRAIPQSRVTQSMHIKCLSSGEWVEVQGDISPGWNSEGGIGVITKVTDGLADVKYVLTRWVEKLVPLRRLTTIIMPHRAAYATLRPTKHSATPASKDTGVSQLRSMSAIQLLKYGIKRRFTEQKGGFCTATARKRRWDFKFICSTLLLKLSDTILVVFRTYERHKGKQKREVLGRLQGTATVH